MLCDQDCAGACVRLIANPEAVLGRVPLVGLNPTRILVANSKIRVMILFTLGSEGQGKRVDSYAETSDSVGESKVERIHHQYQQVRYQGQ